MIPTRHGLAQRPATKFCLSLTNVLRQAWLNLNLLRFVELEDVASLVIELCRAGRNVIGLEGNAFQGAATFAIGRIVCR